MFTDLALSLAYVFLAVVLVVLAKVALNLLSPFNLDKHLTQEDNPALAASVAGYFLAVFIVYIGVVSGPSIYTENPELVDFQALGLEALTALGWALLGVVLVNISRYILDVVLLRNFSMKKEILEDRNAGAGAVECGFYVATALMISGSLSGQGGGILTALAFYALGQIALIIFGQLYELLVKYDLHKELEEDNVAAGVSFGGNIIAVGIILLKATGGDFVSWENNLSDFGYYALVGFLALAALYKITDHLVMNGTTLEEEIAQDRNLGAAWIEAAMALGVAGTIYVVM